MKKALVVGINKYPSVPLHGCIRDATEFANLIESHGDQSANFNVLLKTDIEKKSKLLELIKDLFSGRNEIALFYFSGHGYTNEVGTYLLTPDHRKYEEGVSMNDILTLANTSPTTHKIIILDCCYSGAIARPNLLSGSIGHINEGITILTASRHNEIAMEVKGKGVFTTLLLEALKGGAANINGDITPGGIYTYVDQALGPWEQRPVFRANVSRFVPVRKVSPLLPIETLKNIVNYFSSPESLFYLDPSYEYTNDPDLKEGCIQPFAEKDNVFIFNDLQKMHRAGLLVPVGEVHMYWAAIHKKACRLTLLGHYYWRLVKDKRI